MGDLVLREILSGHEHIFSPCFSFVGLKHVADNQKTHKNPNLRFQATPNKTKSPEKVKSPKAAVQKKPPLLELEGKKWRVVCTMFTFTLDYSQRKLLYCFPQPQIIYVIPSLTLAGELRAETRPCDRGNGTETSCLRLQLQQLHPAD